MKKVRERRLPGIPPTTPLILWLGVKHVIVVVVVVKPRSWMRPRFNFNRPLCPGLSWCGRRYTSNLAIIHIADCTILQ